MRVGHLRIVLAAFVALGLLMAPLSVSAMPKSDSKSDNMSHSMDMSGAMDMSGDMPCCPDEGGKTMPQDNGCKDCPLMAVCSPQIISALPAFQSIAGFDLAQLTWVVAPNDRLADGLHGSPPTRPPRSLV